MFEREQREVRVRLRVPRKRWLVLVAFGMALAIGVPIAWATFSDVGPGNPFYADVNAIQGAGITQGCGGGNFCPNDNITREAEAAFQHRGLGRVAYGTGGFVTIGGTATTIATVTINVGGVTGQTQFVKLDASLDSEINSTTSCPCDTALWIQRDGTGQISQTLYQTNPASLSNAGFNDVTASVTTVVAVPSGTTQTFRLEADRASSGGTVYGLGSLTAVTAPFGHTGAGALAVQSAPGNAAGSRDK